MRRAGDHGGAGDDDVDPLPCGDARAHASTTTSAIPTAFGVSGADLYAAALDQIAWADRHGFAG